MKHCYSIIALFALLVFGPYKGWAQAQADSIKVYNAEIDSKNVQIGDIKSALDVNKASADSIQEQLKAVQAQLSRKLRDENAQKKLLKKQEELIKKQAASLHRLDSMIQINMTLSNSLDTIINKKQQVALSLNDSIETQQKEITTQQKDIESQKATIASQKDSMEIKAELTMNDSITIRYYKKDDTLKGFEKGKSIKKYKISKVYIKVKEGMVLEVNVETDFGSFRNEDFVTNLLHYNTLKSGKLRLKYVNQKYQREGPNLYIFLDDVLKYTPHSSYFDLPYADFDILLVNDTLGHKTYLMKESTSLNTYFNISAFTDIKGISGSPNSIVQFVADAKFITNTSSLWHRSTVPFHFLAFQGGFAKFDNDFKGSPIYTTGTADHDSVSRRDLLQRAHYYAGVKLNLLRGFESPYPWHLISGWQLNVGYNFVGSRVYDTSFKDAAKTVVDTAYRSTTQNQLYIEPTLSVSRHRNFSMTIRLPVYWMSVKKSEGIANNGWETWAAPGITLMYYGKRDEGSKIFLRYNHFINLNDKTQAFSQIQLGFSVNLTDIWNAK